MKFRSLLCALLAAMVVPCAGLFFLDVDNTRTNVPPPYSSPEKEENGGISPRGEPQRKKRTKGNCEPVLTLEQAKKLIGH